MSTFKERRKSTIPYAVKIWGHYDDAEKLQNDINEFIQRDILMVSDVRFDTQTITVVDKCVNYYSAFMIYIPMRKEGSTGANSHDSKCDFEETKTANFRFIA